uniref:Uncharacterized protein n=1 Tax=Aegilops tauschii subsp. strangulata TaxID=200361 RepID=A0A453GD94_AEGTS
MRQHQSPLYASTPGAFGSSCLIGCSDPCSECIRRRLRRTDLPVCTHFPHGRQLFHNQCDEWGSAEAPSELSVTSFSMYRVTKSAKCKIHIRVHYQNHSEHIEIGHPQKKNHSEHIEIGHPQKKFTRNT